MIDWTKPVRTKATKSPVKILSLNGPGDQSVVGFVENGDTDVYQWFPGGGFCRDPQASPMDLENVPPPLAYSIKCTAGEVPGRAWCWVVQYDYGRPQKRSFAICDTRDDAETIMHLLNGTR